MRSYTALAEPDAVWLISDTCLGPTNLCCLCQQSSINWLNSLFFICSLSFNNININIDVTEAPFMVKFEITIFFLLQIFAQLSLGKIFETLTNIQLDPFPA